MNDTIMQTDLADAFAAAGITIADPSPPEAMVKLAETYADAVVDIKHGHVWTVAFSGYLAALQHVEKLVKDAPVVNLLGASSSLVSRNFILDGIGGEA